MPKLILHVGTGKTGTTSIQVALKRNQEALANLGYHVVESRRTSPQLAKHKLDWRDPDDEGWLEFAAEAERVLPTGRHLIISNEGLWRVDPDSLRHMASVFKGYEPMVVLYVREQVEWVQSSLLQKQKKVKKRKRFDLSKTEKLGRRMRRRPLDYLKLCQGMESALGEGSVHARFFNRSAFVDGDLLVDFFHAIGVPDPHALDLAQGENNPSMAAQFAAILAKVKKGSGDLSLRNKPLQDLACRLTANGVGSRYFMTREQVEELRASFRESNQVFVKTYLKNATSLPEKNAWVNADDESVEVIEARMMEIINRLTLLGSAGWSGQQRSAGKIFAEGWTLAERSDDSGTEARLAGSQAVIGFRLPFRRRHWHKDGVQIALLTAGGQPLTALVAVNGVDLGRLNLPIDLLRFPVECCEPIDEVRIALQPQGEPASWPAITAIEILSLKREDDLDEEGEEGEDEDDDDMNEDRPTSFRAPFSPHWPPAAPASAALPAGTAPGHVAR